MVIWWKPRQQSRSEPVSEGQRRGVKMGIANSKGIVIKKNYGKLARYLLRITTSPKSQRSINNLMISISSMFQSLLLCQYFPLFLDLFLLELSLITCHKNLVSRNIPDFHSFWSVGSHRKIILFESQRRIVCTLFLMYPNKTCQSIGRNCYLIVFDCMLKLRCIVGSIFHGSEEVVMTACNIFCSF